ncbi:hypothetical protein [Microcoleus sp. CAWBG58]|nr:hypothetical protein [Microcoleus sp. CAWBG58]
MGSSVRTSVRIIRTEVRTTNFKNRLNMMIVGRAAARLRTASS